MSELGDILRELEALKLDKDNFPRMSSERVGSVDLCQRVSNLLQAQFMEIALLRGENEKLNELLDKSKLH